ncbi:MAG: L,D-transpeptidase [Rhodocyclaceae bacterium]
MRARVSIGDQSLDLFDEQGVRIRRYRVSTAANGAGELAGSQRTPRGHHIVRARVGAGQPRNAVFRARRPTGEVWTPAAAQAEPTRDWILSRILWLSGTEVGFNRLGNVDTMRRYIYIHGTPDTEPMGVPGSHGCIRMRNDDVIELFELLPAFSVVDIEE